MMILRGKEILVNYEKKKAKESDCSWWWKSGMPGGEICTGKWLIR
jgi:hypothetical protein